MNTILSNASEEQYQLQKKGRRRLPLLTILFVLILLLIALVMRLYTLHVPFDRDSYDEGVYWQTLRDLSLGHPLYSSTFYSQPPMFILSVFPIYMLAGQTIWAARLGVALISLLGLVGAFLLGYAIRGRAGGFVALILCMTSQSYLAASQTLQAEGTQVAFTLLAIAFAYLWWQHPAGKKGIIYAALCTLTLVLSIACKLFGLSTLVPIALIALAQIWRAFEWPFPHLAGLTPRHTASTEKQRTDVTRAAVLQSLIWGIIVLVLASAAIILPYIGNFHAFWSQVVSFHNAATGTATRAGNREKVTGFLLSPLGLTALLGLGVASYRRDWRTLPLLAWLLASAVLLWRQEPLFLHHLVILVPTLVGLSAFALDAHFLNRLRQMKLERPGLLLYAFQSLALFLVICTTVLNLYDDVYFYHHIEEQAVSSGTQRDITVAHQLQQITQPSQYVITDAQFLTGLADRNTPPALVDTSSVHIQTNYLTADQLIQEAQQPQVKVVLFYTGRLTQLPTFHSWVAQHYHLVHTYGKGEEMWIKTN